MFKCWIFLRGVAQFGRAIRSGRMGRWFESSHLDHHQKKPLNIDFSMLRGFSRFILNCLNIPVFDLNSSAYINSGSSHGIDSASMIHLLSGFICMPAG